MTRNKRKPPRPQGDKITVGPDERAWFKAERIHKGMEQKEVAAKVGCSPSTISNLETGRHPQIFKSVYIGLCALFPKEGTTDAPSNTTDWFSKIADGAATLPESDQELVSRFIETLKQSRTKPE